MLSKHQILQNISSHLNKPKKMDLDDEYVGLSYHFNDGRRMMTREEEENVDWDNINGAEIPIVKDFVKLCLVEDEIWHKIEEDLGKPLEDNHPCRCGCCSTQDGD